MNQLVLCTDLDRTLIPNGTYQESLMAREVFGLLARREDVTLVYVSGRSQVLIEEAMLTYDLPQPAFVIADVGANIYRIEKTDWRQMKNWCAHISADWRGLSYKELYPLLKGFPFLLLQERTKQRRHKLSFYVPLDVFEEACLEQIKQALLQADIRANIIWSIDEEAGIGLLDVLPASANKLLAIRFLMLQKSVSADQVIFAGDSGNDADVFLGGIPSVLVANAHRDIRRLAETASLENLYIARGGYLGMNGNYSAGILEGVAHFHPELDEWLRSHVENGGEG